MELMKGDVVSGKRERGEKEREEREREKERERERERELSGWINECGDYIQ